jgi:hypothetical protein
MADDEHTPEQPDEPEKLMQVYLRRIDTRLDGIAQGEAEIQPNRVLDDLGREAMAAVAERSHGVILPDTPLAPEPVSVTMSSRAPALVARSKRQGCVQGAYR